MKLLRVIPALLAASFAYAQEAPKDLQLFLLIGQSNMAGRGQVEAADKQPIPGVFMLTKDMRWVPAVDPLHFDKPDIAGVGIGRSFAKVLVRLNPKASIGLIPAAFGGTSLDQWKPGGELYTNAAARAREAMKSGRLRGILWHQGEADSRGEETIATYRERWTKLMEALRKELNAPDVPIVVGELGEFFTARAPLAPKINEQLALLPLHFPRTAFVSSAGLKDKGDSTHFDTPSVREFGRRYAHAFLMLDSSWE
ncbi:MAG: Carbohydrate acetyl esterase/feruloyl esterase [Bryobacteraceae bacterium]|nr:Carbohydrate acetyl esterase/feruloyl esterase [Bryobacteraceae bacterium]